MSSSIDMDKIILRKKNRSFGGWVEYYTHQSQSTQTPMNFSVYRPPQADTGDIPALLWLSGLTCSEENFMAKSGAQQWASQKGLMIFCPDTSPRDTGLPGEADDWAVGQAASFYVNATREPWAKYYQMYDYICCEFLNLMQQAFPVDPARIGISGHSMGGHGALMIGLRNPSQFRTISAFSPIVAPAQCPWGETAFAAFLGDHRKEWKEYDSSELIKKADVKKELLIDQGMADEFLEKQLKTDILQQVCQEAEYPVNIRRHDGYDHSYYFVASFIKDHIDFHSY